ncbi:MAG: hypothetical protein FJ243_00530 [Nitrospira sp.]|nr:hypothetical protein [Nitrospira sp.]
MGKKLTILVAGIAMVLLIAIYSCAPGQYLRTGGASPSEITGTFALILYGGRYSTDLETIAILDQEGDPYTFEVYAPEFDYKVLKGISAKDALERAAKFVSSNPYYRYSRLGKIFDPQGRVIGYEVRPIYDPLLFRFPDVLLVYYRIVGDKVIVDISLTPEAKRWFYGDEEPLIFGPRFRR